DLDALVIPRQKPVPALDVSVAEIIDFLCETGKRLHLDKNAYLQEALERMILVHPAGRRILTACYEDLASCFDREGLEFQVNQELGGADVLDGWRTVEMPAGAMIDPARKLSGRRSAVRALPARLIHILPGNGPQGAPVSIIRGALTKSV